MLVLGSMSYVPKKPCPSVSSPKKVSLSSLGGLGSRRLQGCLGRDAIGLANARVYDQDAHGPFSISKFQMEELVD